MPVKRKGGRFLKRLKKKTNKRLMKAKKEQNKLKKEIQALKKATKQQNKFKVVTNIRRTNKLARRRRRRSKPQKKSLFGGFMAGDTGNIIASMAYGAVREKISDAINQTPLGQIPAGQASDEIALMTAGVVSKKVFKVSGLMRKFINAGISIEAARTGEIVADVGLGNLLPVMGGQKKVSAGQKVALQSFR